MLKSRGIFNKRRRGKTHTTNIKGKVQVTNLFTYYQSRAGGGGTRTVSRAQNLRGRLHFSFRLQVHRSELTIIPYLVRQYLTKVYVVLDAIPKQRGSVYYCPHVPVYCYASVSRASAGSDFFCIP